MIEVVWLSLRTHTRTRFVLQVPLDASECADRLADLTSQSGYSRYLRESSFAKPDPDLRGRVSGDRVYVARWESTLGRRNFTAWLDAAIKPSEGRSCVIDGWVSLARSWAFVQAWLSVTFVVVSAAMVSGGIAALAEGSAVGIPLLLIDSVLIGAATVILRSGLRDFRREAAALKSAIPRLLATGTGDGR